MISFSFPNSQIQNLLFVIAILILSGVNACSQNTSTNQTIASQCPTQPKGFLDPNNVREISLSNQAVKVSGMATSNQSTGYSFEAKSGQNLKYQTKDDICVWIYSPDNQILNTTTLPQTGKYTLQVSTLQGSKTFEMEMVLDSVQGCPEKPKIAIGAKNIKQISINNQTVKESGQVSINTSVGYTFEAKSGQKLTYRTNPALCVWIYAPDTQLLKNVDLPQNGQYTIQVSALQGSTTFELEMTLGTLQTSLPTVTPSTTTATSTSTPISTTTYTPPSTPEPQRPAADNFIRAHYSDLNNRQYQKTWRRLSPEFQNISSSYLGYVGWWDSVREIKIGEVNLVNQNSESAIVDADLWYVMKRGGKPYRDPKKRIYLRWSDQDNSWLFIRKSKP